MDGLRGALRFFEAYDSFVLTTHEGPDADGLGAEVLLLKALKHLRKKARAVNSDAVQERFAFLDPENLIESWNPSAHGLIADGAALVILDTDVTNLGQAGEEMIPRATKIFVVDHHAPLENDDTEGYIDTAASSTSELALEIARGLGAPIDSVSARAAFAGIVYDTGSFMYPKTSARTFRAAIELMEAGAVPNDVYRAMYESSSTSSLLLQKLVLATLELRKNGRVAIQTMTKSDILSAGARYEESESLINIPLRCKEIEVSILFKESEEGRLRCSMRSKGAVDVALIAQSFGGGGHHTAAGFKCRKGLAETREEVLKKVSAAISASESGGE